MGSQWMNIIWGRYGIEISELRVGSRLKPCTVLTTLYKLEI
jgi:hypothetical protein